MQVVAKKISTMLISPGLNRLTSIIMTNPIPPTIKNSLPWRDACARTLSAGGFLSINRKVKNKHHNCDQNYLSKR